MAIVDADGVLQRDSLTRAVRPFLENPETVPAGGAVRIANVCRVPDGFLEEDLHAAAAVARAAALRQRDHARAVLVPRVCKPRELALLYAGAVLENFGYRQLTVWWRLKGTFRWLSGRRHRWETITRSASVGTG